MAPSERGDRLDVLRDDCRKLFSVLCEQEIARNKKRRWLIGGTSCKDDEKEHVLSKFLPEPLVRSDDVPFLTMKMTSESNFTPLIDIQQSNHVVADYQDLFNSSTIEKLSTFMETFSSALDNLKSNILIHVAQVVAGSKSAPWTRGAMKRMILKVLPEIYLQSKHEKNLKMIHQLSQIFKNPINFRKQMRIITPVTASILSSIKNILLKIEAVPTQVLIAMKRKLDDDAETVVPQLPIMITYKRQNVLNKVQLKCHEILRTLKCGDDLPKPFAKALSVMSLTLKEKERRTDLPTTEFYPFTPGTEALQNDILMAIWSIPKVKTDELKRLRDLVDPDGKLPLKTFRTALFRFLLEYLFECDAIDVPKSFFKLLSLINRKSRRQLDFMKATATDVDVEPVMNVSSQLKQILWDSFLDNSDQKVLDMCIESLESDIDEDTDDAGDDIIIEEDRKCSGFASEGMDESEPAGYSKDVMGCTYDLSTASAGRPGCGIDGELNNDGSQQPEFGAQGSKEYGSYHNIQHLCDDTSLFAHRLIDHVLEKLRTAGPQTSGSTDDCASKLLIQAVEELVPSFSQRGIEKAKNFMGIL